MDKSRVKLFIKIDTKVLRISQILGYFPIPVENGSHTALRKNISTVPSLLFCLFGFGCILIFTYHIKADHVHYGAPEVGPQFFSSTFYATVFLKGTAHIFTIIFVRLTIFLSREELSKFYDEFVSLVEQFSLFFHTTKTSELTNAGSAIRNRFEGRFKVEIILLGLSCFVLIIDMWEAHISNPAAGTYKI